MPLARRATSLSPRTAATILVDGAPVAARPGESVAAALLAAGVTGFRRTARGEPRAPFCVMGACFECAVEIDGQPLVRACLAPVREGMAVRTAARG